MKPQKYDAPREQVKNCSLLSTSLTHNHLYDLIVVEKVRKCALNVGCLLACLCVRLFNRSFLVFSFHFVSFRFVLFHRLPFSFGSSCCFFQFSFPYLFPFASSLERGWRLILDFHKIFVKFH